MYKQIKILVALLTVGAVAWFAKNKFATKTSS